MRHLLVVAISLLSPLLPLAALPGQTPSAVTLIDTFMKRAVEYGQFNGAILVIDRGRRVYERAFGEANKEWHVPNTLLAHGHPGSDHVRSMH